MSTLDNHIKDLIQFYVRTNYDKYLIDEQVTVIPDNEIDSIIGKLYDERKEHLQVFIKESLKTMLKEECPDDLVILNVLLDIFSDDELCRNRLIMEVKLHQSSLQRR
jgi:hypothetical protein